MEAQQNLADRLPDHPLYHYSSPGGLLGLIESKSLRMSNIRYQNDSEEYKHAFKLFKKIIEEEYGGYDLETYIGAESWGSFVPSVFTFSLTENKDLLSQWRGYCPKGGYSFGFEKNQLNAFIAKFSLAVHQCVYNDKDQRALIRKEVIRQTPEEWEESKTSGTPGHQKFMYLLKYIKVRLASIAPLLKHHAFEEEAEWRLIMDFDSGGPEIRSLEEHPAFNYIRAKPKAEIKEMGAVQFLNFREDKGILVPYLSLPLVDLDNDYEFVKLSEVIIAPGVRQELAKPACQRMLRNWGADCPVGLSDAPYLA